MLDPEVAQKLLEEIPECKALVAHLAGEALKLNELSDIKVNDPLEVAIEVRARQRSYETIVKILEPLLNSTPKSAIMSTKDEYNINVD